MKFLRIQETLKYFLFIIWLKILNEIKIIEIFLVKFDINVVGFLPLCQNP